MWRDDSPADDHGMRSGQRETVPNISCTTTEGYRLVAWSTSAPLIGSTLHVLLHRSDPGNTASAVVLFEKCARR